MNEPLATRPVRVWDLPTRVFHAVLGASIVGSIVTAKVGGAAMPWHLRLGALALVLLSFRVVWGFVGGHWSRFASFLYGPRDLAAYLRGETGPGGRYTVGHNPLGAWSVFAMLLLLVVQVATGLVADDEIATTGPLNPLVSDATALLATAWHKRFGSKLIVLLIVVHIAAVLVHRYVKGHDLLTPMLTGDKALPAAVPASADGPARWAFALVVVAACAAAAVWVVSLAG